jgi:hypothetical protein
MWLLFVVYLNVFRGYGSQMFFKDNPDLIPLVGVITNKKKQDNQKLLLVITPTSAKVIHPTY